MLSRCAVLCVYGIRRLNFHSYKQECFRSVRRKQLLLAKTRDKFQVRHCFYDGDINIDYDELVSKLKDDKTLLIDVREPYELEHYGVYPKAINIPVGEIAQALTLSPDIFKSQYGVELPDEDDDIVFACMAGIRSMRAAIIAHQLGFNNSKNYKGGYYEWMVKSSENKSFS